MRFFGGCFLAALLTTIISCGRSEDQIASGPKETDSINIPGSAQTVKYEINTYWSRLADPPKQAEVTEPDYFPSSPADWRWYQGQKGEFIALRVVPADATFVTRFNDIFLHANNPEGLSFLEGYRWHDEGGIKVLWTDNPERFSSNATRDLGKVVLHIRGFRISKGRIDNVQASWINTLESAKLSE